MENNTSSRPYNNNRNYNNNNGRDRNRDRPPREIRREVTIQSLLESGAHFGTPTAMWHPKMAPFIYGIRRGKGDKDSVYIINLDSTIKMWKKAREVIVDNISKGGELLFVGTKDMVKDVVIEEASNVGAPYVQDKWLGGMLTNLNIMKRSVVKLNKLEDFVLKAELEDSDIHVSKKELLYIKKDIDGLTKKFGGVRNLKQVPTLVFITDVEKNRLAVAEAVKLGIPVIALVDTSVDPGTVNFPIPTNDDSNSAQSLFIRCVADAVAEGKAIFEANKKSTTEMKDGPTQENGEATQYEVDKNVSVSVKRKR